MSGRRFASRSSAPLNDERRSRERGTRSGRSVDADQPGDEPGVLGDHQSQEHGAHRRGRSHDRCAQEQRCRRRGECEDDSPTAGSVGIGATLGPIHESRASEHDSHEAAEKRRTDRACDSLECRGKGTLKHHEQEDQLLTVPSPPKGKRSGPGMSGSTLYQKNARYSRAQARPFRSAEVTPSTASSDLTRCGGARLHPDHEIRERPR